MLTMDYGRNTRKACGNQPFEKRSPRVRVDDVRPLAPEQSIHRPYKTRIVPLAPAQLEDRHARRNQLPQKPSPLGTADRALNAQRVEPVHHLDDTKFHPTRL